MRKPRSWRRRPIAASPFTQDEDHELKQMVRCGLDCDFYQVGLPHRSFGEILERRLQLIQAGELERARAI